MLRITKWWPLPIACGLWTGVNLSCATFGLRCSLCIFCGNFMRTVSFCHLVGPEWNVKDLLKLRWSHNSCDDGAELLRWLFTPRVHNLLAYVTIWRFKYFVKLFISVDFLVYHHSSVVWGIGLMNRTSWVQIRWRLL